MEEKTVAELTIFYKHQRLTSLIFDTQETADKFVESIMHFFNKKRKERIYIQRRNQNRLYARNHCRAIVRLCRG